MKNRISILLLLASVGIGLYAQTITPTATTQYGYVNNSFSLTFGCTSCGSVSGWVLTGSLPPGLSFNNTTGTISGVPTTIGSYSIVVSPIQYSVRVQYTINIDNKLDFITNSSLGTVTAGTPINRTIQVTAPGITEYGSLPANLTLTFKPGDVSAVLGGSFAAVSAQTTQSFTVYANNQSQYSSQSVSRTFSFVVNPAPSLILNLPTGQVGTAYQGSITTSGGTSPFTYSVSGSFPPGLQLDSTTGLVRGTPTTPGDFSFTAVVTDSSNAVVRTPVTLTITTTAPVITTGPLPNGISGTPYTTTTLAASGGVSPYTWSVTAGSLPAGLTLSTAGVISGTPTAAGASTFTVQAKDSQSPGQTATKAFTITIAAGLSISTSTLPDGVVKVAYSGKVSANGGTTPYTFSLSGGTSLPPGLTLASSGDITGTPTTAATYNFTIGVTDATQKTATQSFKVVINPALAFSTTSLPDGQRGKAYSGQIGAVGGVPAYSFTVSAGSLPAGLTLATSGAISGTPTASGTANFTVRLIDQTSTAITQAFSIAIAEPVVGPSITTTALSDGTVGNVYSASLAATGTAPLAWSVTTGALPDGLSLGASGAISGTPTTAGSSTFTVQVSDGNKPSLTATASFTINVNLPALPPVSVTQVTDTTTSTSQPTFGISLGQTFPADLSGTATISFQPDAGPGDPDVLFLNGKTTVAFTVPKGSSTATSSDKLAFSAGTTSGTITITITVAANGQTLTPNPAATRTVKIAKAAPVITSVKVNRTSAGFEVAVIGYSNTREISGSTFHFNGTGLTSSDFTVAVSPAFTTWYSSSPSAQYGTQFLFTMPFTLSQGAISALTSVQVTLSNGVGSATSTASF